LGTRSVKRDPGFVTQDQKILAAGAWVGATNVGDQVTGAGDLADPANGFGRQGYHCEPAVDGGDGVVGKTSVTGGADGVAFGAIGL